MAMKKNDSPEISVVALRRGEVVFNIVGSSPLIYNRVSEKAKRELLMPKEPYDNGG